VARAGERFQTEFQCREFALVKRERRSAEGWQMRFSNGDINWISDWQLTHCHKVSPLPLSSDEEGR